MGFHDLQLAREDLRPGDRIAVLAERGPAGLLRGLRIDVAAREGPGFLLHPRDHRRRAGRLPKAGPQGGTKEQTAARESAERRFLDGYDRE